jgi:hypothetical protein
LADGNPVSVSREQQLISGSNIGTARLQVTMLPSSPFNSVVQQEFSCYYTLDNIKSMTSLNLVEALPAAVDGYRLIEAPENYDNFIQDVAGTYLEDATYNPSSGPAVQVDDLATWRANPKNNGRPISADQKTFFTWRTCDNLFTQVPLATSSSSTSSAASSVSSASNTTINPPPTTWDKMAVATDNTPKWTYNLKEKADGTNNMGPLTPFMTRTNVAPGLPVNWGCKTITALAQNQPFEILFYHDGQVVTIAQDAPNLTPRWTGFEDVPTLSQKAYFALEIGIGTQAGQGLQHFLFLFVQGMPPRAYQIGPPTTSSSTTSVPSGSSLVASFIEEFEGFDGSKLFDPENSYFTVKVEPVSSGLLITSNQFNGQSWFVNGSPQVPFMVGAGQIAVYSGNVQAGFAMRPVQYVKTGSFVSTAQTFVLGGTSGTPSATMSLKGSGDSQQSQSPDGNVYAVDCEFVNEDGAGKIQAKTYIEAESGLPFTSGWTREIDINAIIVNNPETNVSQFPAFGPDSVAELKSIDYAMQIKMTATDVAQGNGYVVTNGRSPYIWQSRLELSQPPAAGKASTGIDISCDVLSCDFQWNSTSYNEISHTGTIKVLNRPCYSTGGGTGPYADMTNRAIYLNVQAWWENGGGYDPGGAQGSEASPRMIFSGMTVGATVETKAEREVVVFKVEDYMNALEGCKFYLSPYYDGMKASKAVRDIVAQLGVPDSNILANGSPISSAPDDPDEFGLPFVNPFEEPQFRFKDGSSLKSAVVRIATIDGKTIYFDAQGRFNYDDIPGGIFGDLNVTPKAQFFTSPADANLPSQVVWNMGTYTRAVNDTYNMIRLKTVDKDTGNVIIMGDDNQSSISDPTSEGYLGYKKIMFVFEASLGTAEAAALYLDKYRRHVYFPPITTKFETFGYTGLKPLDTISLDGNMFRIVNISIQMDKQNNQYWMNVEGEWFFSQQKGQNDALDSAINANP